MARYIVLISLTPEGRENVLQDSNVILNAEADIGARDARILGLYAVLGDIDFVAIMDADDNEAMARFALDLGARAGLQTSTLPAISIARLGASGGERSAESTHRYISQPGDD